MPNRIDIPPEIAAQVLFDSDRTCCICQEPGKAIQIHHIDEDSSNSFDLANLAVVCFEDHDKTMVRGGFGRKLASRYRWHRARWEPLGAGTGGTIIRVFVAGDVMADLEAMISEIASNLLRQSGPTESVDFQGWSKEWKDAGEEDNG